LENHVCKHAKVREYNQGYHPDRLDLAGNIMTPEQVAKYCNEQPEPYDEHEYREGIGQEIAEGETFVEEHSHSPWPVRGPSGTGPIVGG
jgi:hypothetical protein